MSLNQVQFVLQLAHIIFVFIVAVEKRIDFINSMDTHFSQTHVIKRSEIYEDLMVLFENQNVLSEYPLCISFAGS